MANAKKHGYEYDLVVIGGGSGGLAASKEATKVNPNAKVLVFDYVQPSVLGTKWGLGGTCVNVGCVPKKLMHHASLMGHMMQTEAPEFGWQGLDHVTHDWMTLRDTVTNYIRSLNFSYRSGLRGANVQYIEGYAQFGADAHTLLWKGNNNKSGQVTADKIIVATGGRPNMGSFPGKEVCLTSDDIFWTKQRPGKTLVIGAGYIALECAGFLHHLGMDVTMMVRGEFMRKFDQQCAAQMGEHMERSGVRFLMPASPVSFKKVQQPQAPAGSTRLPSGLIQFPDVGDGITRLLHPSGAIEQRPHVGRSTWKIPDGPVLVEYVMNTPGAAQHTITEQFDSVFIATGRTACVEDLGLDKFNIAVRDGKILVNDFQCSSIPHIYALGDVSIGAHSEFPELTPVAIKVGVQVAQHMFAQNMEKFRYDLVASTVFGPVEYGFVGVSQEQAEKEQKAGGIGAENVEVYYSRFGHLEISPTHAHAVPLRSRVFVGRNSWARRYCERHQLVWPELGLEEGTAVLLPPVNAAAPSRHATIRSRYQAAGNGQWVCDVELAPPAEGTPGELVKGVPIAQLELAPEVEAENAELFLKATNLAKLVVDKRNDRVLGIHFIGPNAGEVLQGFSMALMFGAKKADFDRLTGIHPTAAEEFCVLTVTKSSGKSPLKKAGCGGGSCG